MTETLKPPSPEAISLVAAAVHAVPAMPADPAQRASWFADVEVTASELARRAQKVDHDLEVLASCRVVTGVIDSVTERSKRGVITIRPTMGRRQDKLERLRTPWLHEPAGAAMFAQAQALVGVHCRFGKFNEAATVQGEDGEEDVKVGMCAWLEPMAEGGSPTTRPAGPEPSTTVAPPAPHPPSTTPAPPEPTTPPPTVAPRAPSSGAGPLPDRRTLLAVAPKTWDQLVEAASEYFNCMTSEVMQVGMAQFGAAGPTKQPHFARLWMMLVDRYQPKAA